ncbi:hypothetical protein Tco_0930877 [Tanacetum coccineum]
MAAGSKDRPPMLGPGRYSQWRSHFLRYIDSVIVLGSNTRICSAALSRKWGCYMPSTVLVQAVATTEVLEMISIPLLMLVKQRMKCG